MMPDYVVHIINKIKEAKEAGDMGRAMCMTYGICDGIQVISDNGKSLYCIGGKWYVDAYETESNKALSKEEVDVFFNGDCLNYKYRYFVYDIEQSNNNQQPSRTMVVILE
jgi:hypothetical protein